MKVLAVTAVEGRVPAAVDEGLIRGPRLLTAVAIISPIGGIGDRVSPSGHECLVPHDPALPAGVANGVAEVRRRRGGAGGFATAAAWAMTDLRSRASGAPCAFRAGKRLLCLRARARPSWWEAEVCWRDG